MGWNPSYFKGSNNPVEQVSWFDAIDYCNKRSEQEGREPVYNLYRGKCIEDFSKNGYRLPTSAEWEWAASGGIKAREIHKYSGSNNIDEVAWYWDNSNKTTHPVMQKRPNELGIYDMTGNVWEWCWDTCNGANVWNENKNEWEWSDNVIGRVNRGGGWYSNPEYCEVSHVNSFDPSCVIISLGFRVALSFS